MIKIYRKCPKNRGEGATVGYGLTPSRTPVIVGHMPAPKARRRRRRRKNDGKPSDVEIAPESRNEIMLERFRNMAASKEDMQPPPEFQERWRKAQEVYSRMEIDIPATSSEPPSPETFHNVTDVIRELDSISQHEDFEPKYGKCKIEYTTCKEISKIIQFSEFARRNLHIILFVGVDEMPWEEFSLLATLYSFPHTEVPPRHCAIVYFREMYSIVVTHAANKYKKDDDTLLRETKFRMRSLFSVFNCCMCFEPVSSCPSDIKDDTRKLAQCPHCSCPHCVACFENAGEKCGQCRMKFGVCTRFDGVMKSYDKRLT